VDTAGPRPRGLARSGQLHHAGSRALGLAHLRALGRALERGRSAAAAHQLEHRPSPANRYWNDAWGGYPVARERLQLDLRLVARVEDPNGRGYTERSFIVEDGRAGAQPA